jgi:hypothetical protein
VKLLRGVAMALLVLSAVMWVATSLLLFGNNRRE